MEGSRFIHAGKCVEDWITSFRIHRFCYSEDFRLTLMKYLVVAALQGWVTASGFRRCTYSKELKMMGANCYELNFEEIPKTLNKDIEFLYMGKNRIRTLTNSSLQEYTSLRYLYLGDNFIQKIETGAFSELEDLEVLDLSRNALISLPTDLPLPLRKLYLADNQFLRNLSLSAAFNLNFLNIAKCDLKKIPAIGMLPNLQVLNVSDNPLQSVTPADLAPLCRLEVLHLPPSLYSQMDDETLCQCHRLLTWTTQRYIKLPAFNCTPLREHHSPPWGKATAGLLILSPDAFSTFFMSRDTLSRNLTNIHTVDSAKGINDLITIPDKFGI
ncbi:hypothetical protein J6590_044680 [Homalodisca vitripennis]|nr:hypothetical protein J6590_044680 [Homalodisca vitripennis]